MLWHGKSSSCPSWCYRRKRKVYGLDLSLEMLEEAEVKNKMGRVEFKNLDASRTGFPDNYFDAVTLIAALHEMPFEQRSAVLKEAKRILKPAGKLLVGEHFISEYRFPRLFQGAFFRLISKKPERETFKDMNKRGLVQEIEQEGFQVATVQPLPLHLFHLVAAIKSPALNGSPEKTRQPQS